MIDQEFIKNLSSKAADMFPAADKAKAKLEQDLYQLLQRSLARMQLVTQEEFHNQRAVLEQANEKIRELEQKVDSLEKQKQG